MKLFQTTFNPRFIPTIRNWAQNSDLRDNGAIIHIYAPYTDKSVYYKLDRIQKILSIELPGIPIVGCSAIGEIINGTIDYNECVITLMIFEDPSTNISILSYYDEMPDSFDGLIEDVKNITDLKGIEIISSNSDQYLDNITRAIDTLPEEIEVFGAVAVGDDHNKPFIFTDDYDYHTKGAFLVIYSGKELHIQTDRMFGWKAIGYPLHVTKAEGNVVYELDEKPAYDVYSHYLSIKKGPNFFYDALEFPWEVQINDETVYTRHAKSVNPDGSIVMSTSIPVGSKIRLSYGDPIRILEHTKQTGLHIRDFAPQAITIYNCFGRKLFWDAQDNIEIAEISKHLDAAGFSALGEIMRYKGTTVLNNLSVVTVSMREGDKQEIPGLAEESSSTSAIMPISARLAIFINTITEELMEKNNQLNEMLYKASHDALTGLLNRGAIERVIYEADPSSDWYLIMFDIDNFKQINDTFGHQMGDTLIKTYATRFQKYCGTKYPCAKVGGDEFAMIVEGNVTQADVLNLVEQMRNLFGETVNVNGQQFRITMSYGISGSPNDGTSPDSLINAADTALYNAKMQGKDRPILYSPQSLG